MPLRPSWRGCALAVVFISALAACQGNIGSGTGLTIPQAPSYTPPGGPGQQSSRERALEGAVYVNGSPMPTLPLPSVNGFEIEIALGTPGPSPSPAASVSASAAASPAAKTRSTRTKTSAVARPVAAESPAPAVSPASTPSVASSGQAGSTASPAPSGSASAAPANGNHHPSPVPSGPKIVTKTVTYPEDAPVAPTPAPTGAIQTYPVRTAIVRGYVMPAIDIPIYGLGAIRFTVPKEELTTGRGYTIAVFTSAKHHKGKLLEYDTAPTVGATTINSSFTDDPIVFKKNNGYEIVLYGDQLAAAPAQPPVGYPPPANNPLVTPVPSGFPQAPGYPQAPGGYPATAPPPGYATPYPSQTNFR